MRTPTVSPARHARATRDVHRLLSLAVVLATACTHPYVPRPRAIEAGRVDAFTVPAPVTVTNDQPVSTPVVIRRRMGHEWTAELHAWTDTAVRVMRSELHNHDMPVSDRATRTLSLRITRADLESGFATVRCWTDLTVTPDGAEARRFEGSAATAALDARSYEKACEVAVARAVAEALTDPELRAWIAQPAD